MIIEAEGMQKTMMESQHRFSVSVSYNCQKDELYFENLPLMSLILKRVYNEYKDTVVFSLCKMECKDSKVMCVLEFSTNAPWVEVIKDYESSLEVIEYHEGKDTTQDTTNDGLLTSMP